MCFRTKTSRTILLFLEITVKQEEGELKVSIENDVFIEGPSSFIRKITIDEK